MTNLSNIVEILAKQALGANQQSNQSQGGLGGILGSVLGQLSGNNQQSSQGGLGGILGSVLGQLGGQQQRSTAGASGTQSLLVAVLPLVLAWIQKQGGLQGALDKLKGQGLTSQVDDWVSTGPGENAHVGAEQVQSLFDDADVEQVAQQTQAPKQDIYSAISTVLPQIIDSLTPQGEQTSKQEANDDIQQVMNLVSGFLKR
ncbi:YidB family protein [Acinetobacter sp. A1]|uniref:YidB family protein n=1 Tax=Acinetobacter sp. A1 TaxID=401467 RepID=UPI0014455DD4|nr:YidB family protein [Acinetobacter sp. A1]